MQFGFGMPQRFFTEEMDISVLRPLLEKVESLGYHSCWVREQAANARYDLAPIPLLSYSAALTGTVKLGTSVLLSLLHNPVNLAKSLATLDRLSQGRLIVGLGIGNTSSIDVLEAFGISRTTRGRRFEEGLELMKELWKGEPVTFRGEFYNTTELFISPLPVQSPHPPIWFGGHAQNALRRAARFGDGWMEAGARSTAAMKDELATLRQFLEEEGRDPAEFTISKRVIVAVEDKRSTAYERLKDWYLAHGSNINRLEQEAVFGTPDECIEGLTEVAMGGVNLIVLNPLYDYEMQAERLATEVVNRI